MRTIIDCITSRRCWLILSVMALIATMMALTPSTAVAQTQTCLQDQYSKVNSQTLNCTANDVRVAKVINIRNLNGTPLNQCVAGSTINFIADYLVETTSNSSRSNIGLYFGTGNVNTQPTALSGSCSDNIIWPVTNPPGSKCGSDTNVVCGTTHSDEFDASPDNCGDTSSTDPAVCLDANNNVVSCSGGTATQTFPSTQVVTVEIHDFPCVAPTSGSTCTINGVTGQCLVLPNCTSWQVPGKTIQCQATAPYYPYPFDLNSKPEAIPGSPSKCNCGTIPLGILVQTPSIAVGKACTTGTTQGSGTNGAPTFTWGTGTGSGDPDSCDAGIEGATGPVTYTVAIQNQSNVGSVTINQICDTHYGKIYRSSSAPSTLAACSAGTGSISNNTCTGTISVAAGTEPFTCTFQASTTGLEPPTTITDIVSATGTGDLSGGSFGPATSNSVNVYAEEAPSTASVTKSFGTTAAACATVRYKVDVANTTGSTYDETLSLSALNDTSYGSITSVQGSVLGTTCGVAAGQKGLGKLDGYYVVAPGTPPDSTQLPGGLLPYTLTPGAGGHDYVCYFDAQFCSADTGGTLGTIVTTAGKCTAGQCTAGQPGTTACSSDAQCDVSCTGIQHSDSITATITSDESENIGGTTGACSIPAGKTTGTCVAGLVGTSCTTNSQCNSITANTLTVNECITPQ